jgi:uncharacterized protein YndB with AHSA1/START domain
MVTTMKFEGKRILASQITFELVASQKGTDLICTHQGAYFDGDPMQMSMRLEGGWNALMDRLRAILEAE